MTIQIYDRSTIDRLPWPETPNGDYARSLLGPLVREGPRHLLANAEAEVRVLLARDAVMPLVLGNPSASIKNSYVCSPTTHYIDYAIREVEIEMGERPWARALFPRLLGALRPMLRWSNFDHVVYVNNWLLSTNLYPQLDRALLPSIHAKLVTVFPDRPIIFRSVDDQLNGELKADLRRLGFRPVFSRQVYLMDPRDPGYKPKKSLQKDMGLARRSPYRWGDGASIQSTDIPRLKALYDDLYIHKYSFYNPQFTEQFFADALREGWLTFFVLRREGRIDGVLGFVERDGVMTTPLIGYDRSVEQSEGLYRLISLKLIEEARERGLVLNQSSGAAAFKRHRGSEPSMEYNMVYTRHLPQRARLPWRLLHVLTRAAIAPLMERYEL